MSIISPGELAKIEVEPLDGVEGSDPERLLPERADETMGHSAGAAVPVKLPDEAGAGPEAVGLEFSLEGGEMNGFP